MRGATRALDLAGSELLRDFTDSQVVVLFDDLDDWFTQEVNASLTLAREGRPREANKRLTSIEERAASYTQEKCAQLARNFLKRPDRFHVLGLLKGDIVEYLDPALLGIDTDSPAKDPAETWANLRREHAAKARSREDFKEWLRRAYGARINEKTIRDAATLLADHPPEEFVAALNICRWLGRREYQGLSDLMGEDESE
jgi:hypothetical protein